MGGETGLTPVKQAKPVEPEDSSYLCGPEPSANLISISTRIDPGIDLHNMRHQCDIVPSRHGLALRGCTRLYRRAACAPSDNRRCRTIKRNC
jgi:hypothetical protein